MQAPRQLRLSAREERSWEFKATSWVSATALKNEPSFKLGLSGEVPGEPLQKTDHILSSKCSAVQEEGSAHLAQIPPQGRAGIIPGVRAEHEPGQNHTNTSTERHEQSLGGHRAPCQPASASRNLPHLAGPSL